MHFPSVIQWGRKSGFRSQGMAQIIDHPRNAGDQGFLAESDFLIPHLPVASRSDDLSLLRAMQFRQKLQNGDRAGQHIRRFSLEPDTKAGHDAQLIVGNAAEVGARAASDNRRMQQHVGVFVVSDQIEIDPELIFAPLAEHR
jgi:hypothetical protein